MGLSLSLPADSSESLSKTRPSHELIRAERVYLYGTGVSGRKRSVPELVEHLQSQYISVADVSCSVDFVIFLSSSGNVYAHGRNDNHQLGVDTNEESPSIVRVPISEPIKSMSTGLFHSVVITDSGEVWTWGMNNKGQCGVGQCSPWVPPTKINIGNRKAVHCACGINVSIILTDRGELLAFGDNKRGQCGLLSLNAVYPKPTMVPLNLEPKERVVHVACSDATALFCTTFGRVFGFGRNNKSQLPGVEATEAPPTHLSCFDRIRVAAVSVGWNCAAIIIDCGSVRCWHWAGDDDAEYDETWATPSSIIGEDSVHQYSAVMVGAMANSFIVITDENELLEISNTRTETVKKLNVGEDDKLQKVRTGPAMVYVLCRSKIEEDMPRLGCFSKVN
ncbi:hypothetical protein GEMRC1_006009 [Eukaryota sp. GEM-RC1]